MTEGDGNPPRLSFRGGEIIQRRANAKVIMTATPRSVCGGDIVTLTWGVTEGTAEFQDWLGLFQENDEKKPLRHYYVKNNKRGGEWSVEAPRETGRYVFKFIKSLFPYDLIHKDYLGLARSNVWEVVSGCTTCHHLGLGDDSQSFDASLSLQGIEGGEWSGTPQSAGATNPPGSTPPPASGLSQVSQGSCSWTAAVHSRSISGSPHLKSSGHRRSGSGDLATLAEGIVGRLPVHPLAWILRRFSSDDELACLKLEDIVELAHQVDDEGDALILAKRLAVAGEQPGPGRRAIADAGGIWALLHLATWTNAEIQKLAVDGLHSLVTYVPVLHGGMYDNVRRLLTFGADFPHDNEPLTPAYMAQTGLYSQPLEPASDRVVCTACGVILEGWVEGQVPAELHRRVSPHCRLLTWPTAPSGPPHLPPNTPPASPKSKLQAQAQASNAHGSPPAHPSLNQSIQGWCMTSKQGPQASPAFTRAWGGGAGRSASYALDHGHFVELPRSRSSHAQAAGDDGGETLPHSSSHALSASGGCSDGGCSETATLEATRYARYMPSLVTSCAPRVHTLEHASRALKPSSEAARTCDLWQVEEKDIDAEEKDTDPKTRRTCAPMHRPVDDELALGAHRPDDELEALDDEAGGVGVLEFSAPPPLLLHTRTRVMDRSLARELLESPEAERALSAISSSTDKQVQASWFRLLAALAHTAGRTKEFQTMCLPRLLVAVATCKDESRMLNVLEALRYLAVQPVCRKYLTTSPGADTLSVLVNALPKWSGRNLEVANRNGGAPSDVWPRLLENAMSVVASGLQHAFEDGQSICVPHGATAAVLCVLAEAPYEHTEVQRAAVACLYTLAAASHPTPPSATQTTLVAVDCGVRNGAGRHQGPVRQRRESTALQHDIKEFFSARTVRRIVELMVRGGDLHLRSSAARLLGVLTIQRPALCLEIACVGISRHDWLEEKDKDGRETMTYALGVGNDAGVRGTGAVDGITALLWLARDTGAARGQIAASCDIICQRMVARCLEAVSSTCHMNPSLLKQLTGMGFKESEAVQALRMAGGSLECAVTWLAGREETPGPGGPEDEFEMVEDAPLDLPAMLMSRGGLDCMAEMLQEHDAQLQASLWKAIGALTRVGARCRMVLMSKVGQEWIIPLVAGCFGGGARIMLGDRDGDRDAPVKLDGVAGAGGSARDSIGSCMLEVVSNLAADAESCRELQPHGIVLLLSSAACAAGARDVVGARTCARGLYYTLVNMPLPVCSGSSSWYSWLPSESVPATAGVSDLGTNGTIALLHLASIADTGVQRWTAMAIHRLCVKALQLGWTALLEKIIDSRGVQSVLHLVYSPAVEVCAYAMATLALISSGAHTKRRALFMAGVLFPVKKLGRNGPLDTKVAAAHILSNLAKDDETLDDMLSGSDEILELALHLLAPSPTNDWQSARRDGRLITSRSSSASPTREEALIEMKLGSLEFLQAACQRERYQPRFLKLSGLQMLYTLAEACDTSHKSSRAVARGIVKVLELLALNTSLRQVLTDGGVKAVSKMLFKRHEDPEIESSMENILVHLNQPSPCESATRDSNTNPSSTPTAFATAAKGNSFFPEGVSSGAGEAAGWRVRCKRTLVSGEKEEWVFSVAESLTFSELQERVCGKFGSPVVIMFRDQDGEDKMITDDVRLAYVMSLPRALLKRKINIDVQVAPTPPSEDGKRMQVQHGKTAYLSEDSLCPERNPRFETEENGTIPSATVAGSEHARHKQLHLSRLCDSSPNFQQRGEGPQFGEGPTLRWRLGKLIGEGAYAKVFQGINADSGELMAVKQVSLSGGHENEKKRLEAVSALQREIEVMKLLQHQNIVKYLGTETTDGRLNIFLEYVSGGSIAQLISNFGALDEPVVRLYTRQIVVGLEFLHSKGIVHCDIKGGNILVTEDGVIKLADFNSSKQLGNIAAVGSNPLRSLLGTPQFMAPEVIKQTGHGKKADIWSVGCTVLQMINGAPPWDEISNKITLMFHIASCKAPPQPPEHVSEEAKAFLRQVLQVEARDRPTCQHLLQMSFCVDKEKVDRENSLAGPS